MDGGNIITIYRSKMSIMLTLKLILLPKYYIITKSPEMLLLLGIY